MERRCGGPETLGPSLDKSRRFHAAFEFARDGAVRQHVRLWRQLESRAYLVSDLIGNTLRIDAAAKFDKKLELVVAILRRDRLCAEVVYALITKHEILELGVVDIHAADLEEPRSPVRVLEARK